MRPWAEDIQKHINDQNYDQALNLCQAWLVEAPENLTALTYAGLCFLLCGEELNAQTLWFHVFLESDSSSQNTELLNLLELAAVNQESLDNLDKAWVIRYYLLEFNKENIPNLLKMVLIEEQLDFMWTERIAALELSRRLAENNFPRLDENDLFRFLKIFFISKSESLSPDSLAFIKKIINYQINLPKYPKHLIFEYLIQLLNQLKNSTKNLNKALSCAELYLAFNPNHFGILKIIPQIYLYLGDCEKAIESAKIASENAQAVVDKIIGKHLILQMLLSCGSYSEMMIEVTNELKTLIDTLKFSDLNSTCENDIFWLIYPFFLFPHLEDQPLSYKKLLQKTTLLFQIRLEEIYQDSNLKVPIYSPSLYESADKLTLKIGYLCSCFSSHAVGILARWLLKYHSCENLKVYLYLINYESDEFDPIQSWYEHQDFVIYRGGDCGKEIAKKIRDDKIQILIELDSITSLTNYEVLSLKPAPIQVSWLGFDAPEFPTIDYFIADPFVLPANAQEYYSEKIWRLPNSYLVVEGFEVGVPNLSRKTLNLPESSVVFFSGQRGNKRNSELILLQLLILKEVKDSYLLIKGISDQARVKDLFHGLAKESGIELERLVFLPLTPTFEEHRANLAIADVILDTYPYNGATTTLEALWMEIPLVTRVGEQFAARNSYTFLMNAGVEEGVAWTDAEYVEWGIKLGQDEELRKNVSWKLKQAKKQAPLWNVPQFAKEMEAGFQAMWHHYRTGEMILPPGHRLG